MKELGLILNTESWMGCEYIDKRRRVSQKKKGNMGKMLAVEMNILFAGTVRETVVLVFGFNYEEYEIRPD